MGSARKEKAQNSLLLVEKKKRQPKWNWTGMNEAGYTIWEECKGRFLI